MRGSNCRSASDARFGGVSASEMESGDEKDMHSRRTHARRNGILRACPFGLYIVIRSARQTAPVGGLSPE
jgi:hypothetical protein